MASLLAHAAIPALLLPLVTPTIRRVAPGRGLERRLAVVAVVLAIWPDADLASLVFEVRPNEPRGHRGLTHSLIVAAVVSLLAGGALFRALRLGSRPWWLVVAFLFGASASHGLLDAATAGDIGVALFAPITNARFAFPFKLVPSCPMGLDEYLGRFGMLTFANEVLYVVIPLALVVSLLDKAAPRVRLAVIAMAWCASVFALRATFPELFRPTVPRLLRPVGTQAAGRFEDVKHDDLPNGTLVTRLDRLQALGLFDRLLVPNIPAWSSSFFPSWFGAEGGRWMDGAPRLVWRTLFGFSPPSEPDAQAWLVSAASGDAIARKRLFSLSPTEKVDLALGRFDFPATAEALSFTHNAKPKPRYWFGRCNGVAAAATIEPEPFRVVDVIGTSGAHIRFHPNDVKSLLAVAYAQPAKYTLIGDMCTTVAFDPGAACSMNPAVLVVALLNRVGIARESLVIDVIPSIGNQYYALANARVRIVGTQRPPGGEPMDTTLASRTASLVDVAIDLTMSSTTLAYARANVIDTADPTGTRYMHVGVVPVPFAYTATLALDKDGELVGGRWTGNPPDGPDNIVIVEGGPSLDEHGGLAVAKYIPWALVRELARASVDDAAACPTLDLRTQCDGRCP
jgi:inner membrane protein